MRNRLFYSSCTCFMLIAAFSVYAAALSDAPQSASASTQRSDAQMDQAMAESCPHALEALKAQQRYADQHRAPPVYKVSRPALQRELLLLVERDQDARKFAMNGATDTDLPDTDPRVMQMAKVDAANLHRLKQIIHQDGFPTPAMVGFNGVQAAFLLTQHADSDPAFQAKMLKVITERVRRGELDAQNFALLTDRVLVHQAKPQRYGTQFTGSGDELKPQPIEDPAHVDQRRAALGLGSLADYACMLRVIYGLPLK